MRTLMGIRRTCGAGLHLPTLDPCSGASGMWAIYWREDSSLFGRSGLMPGDGRSIWLPCGNIWNAVISGGLLSGSV